MCLLRHKEDDDDVIIQTSILYSATHSSLVFDD